jgi:hypothetical protein
MVNGSAGPIVTDHWGDSGLERDESEVTRPRPSIEPLQRSQRADDGRIFARRPAIFPMVILPKLEMRDDQLDDEQTF